MAKLNFLPNFFLPLLVYLHSQPPQCQQTCVPFYSSANCQRSGITHVLICILPKVNLFPCQPQPDLNCQWIAACSFLCGLPQEWRGVGERARAGQCSVYGGHVWLRANPCMWAPATLKPRLLVRPLCSYWLVLGGARGLLSYMKL